MKRAFVLGILVMGLLALPGLATTWVVPTHKPTITEALAAAEPGDTITVTSAYNPLEETFPILVQKDNITIEAESGVQLYGENPSHAAIVVGAYREYDPETHEYKDVPISGVTIKGFTIQGKTVLTWQKAEFDIGIVVKNATNVTIQGNTIAPITEEGDEVLEGIRLIDAEGCTIKYNVLEGIEGVGILIQNSDGNTLENNLVEKSGLGLFILESDDNTVTGDTYMENGDVIATEPPEVEKNGGIVLNDSKRNVLSELLVTKNSGWGVRFVFADENTLELSDIYENTWGGVELLGSQDNVVARNLVYTNGTPSDGSDDAQIVITFGDKAEFTTDIFFNPDYPGEGEAPGLNQLRDEFVLEKHKVEAKLDLLKFWLDDLYDELIDLRKPIIDKKTEEAEARLLAILRNLGATPPYGKITVDDLETEPPTVIFDEAMDDPTLNFTLEAAQTEFNYNGILTYDDLDYYTDFIQSDSVVVASPWTGPNFGLDYDDPDYDYSWDKLSLIDMLLWAARWEINNNFEGGKIDSLIEKLEVFADTGLITDKDHEDLLPKLEGAVAALDLAIPLVDDGTLDTADPDDIVDWIAWLYTQLTTEGEELTLAELLEAEAAIEDLKALMVIYIDLVPKDLCLVDIELPPFPEVNTLLIGKKEKPFAAITDDEIDAMNGDIVTALNGDDKAPDFHEAVEGDETWGADADGGADDIETKPVDLRSSTGNVIASNVITSDLLDNTDDDIGIVIECGLNTIVNNVITNEKVEPIDTEAAYGEFYQLDIAMILLSNQNLIAYNAIEFVNNGIIRGGKWWRKDIQVEYVFDKLALVAYWPPLDEDYEVCDWCDCHKAEDFVRRPVVWVPVLKVTSELATGLLKDDPDTSEDESKIVGFTESQTVTGNRLSLNFFDQTGTGIDIVDAESNDIDENLFYRVTSGNIIFREGAGPGIKLEHNDHYGGTAVVIESTTYTVDASLDYTPPEPPGHASCVGEVNPPAATAPFAYANFGTIDKYEELGIEAYFPGEEAEEILPPNLEFFFPGVVLPGEKPRHPDDIFVEVPGPPCWSMSFPYGWNMVSIPLSATNPAPSAVFGDDGVPATLVFEYIDGEYENPDEILPTLGYWIWIPEEDGAKLDVCGTLPIEDEEVPLAAAGWHMISKSGTSIALQHVDVTDGTDTLDWAEAVTAGWVQPFAFWWDPATKTYDPVDPNGWIDPWNGYWIKTLKDGLTIILPQKPPDGPTSALSPEALGVPSELPPPPPPLPPLAADGLTVRNYPNPIRDVHTTKFQVFAAQPVEAMRVRVYDLSGRLVWQDEVPGGELEWHTDDFTGKFLANGVYLYQAEVKIAGEWHVTKVEKLVIVR